MGDIHALTRTSGRRMLATPTPTVLAYACSFALVTCVTMAVLLLLHNGGSTTVTQLTTNGCRALAAALFLAAGVLRIARWRIVGDAHSGLMGAALLLLGGLWFPLANLAQAISHAAPDSLLVPLTRGLTSLAVLALVATALRCTDGHQVPRFGLLGGAAAAGSLLGFGLLLLVSDLVPAALVGSAPRHVLIAVVLAAGWGTAGVAARQRGATAPWAGRAAPLLLALGVAEVLRGLAAYDRALTAPASLLSASVAMLAGYAALTDLFDAATAPNVDLALFAEALDQARSVLSTQTAWREELTHDARNALAGLRGAIHTLRSSEERLDPATVDQLRSAALAEVEHLEHLISRSDRDELTEFIVDDVVDHVVRSRRATGLQVYVEGRAGTVRGRPGDLVTALQNLLVNADIHGGGQHVTVTTTRIGNRVEVSVADQGGGLTDEEAAWVFERGVRGIHSRGSGLGLHIARTVMREQGGDIALRRYVGGAEFVLTIPAAGHRMIPAPRLRADHPLAAGSAAAGLR